MLGNLPIVSIAAAPAAAPIDTTNWFPRVMRKGYIVVVLQQPYECGGELNYSGYCSPEVDKLIELQSTEADQEKRKQLVWEIEWKLAEDGARPIIFYDRRTTCWQPRVKGLTIMVNSIFNG
jgi:peptide/nickel transport system substrate-binding protein